MDKKDKNNLDKLKKQFSKPSGEENKNQPKGGGGKKFNFYWIYAAIILLFIGMQVFSSFNGNAKKSNIQEFNEMAQAGDVEKVLIVNDKKIEVFIKKDALKNKERYKDLRENGVAENATGPQFQFEYSSEDFTDRIDALADANPDVRSDILIEYTTREDIWGNVFSWIFPLLIFVVIWIFIMRRMSGGGGGPGAQIFNIGKSKAQLFDKNTNVKTTFKDVAGLEGAKEEVEEIVSFLKEPEKYTALGGKIPKGALLVGPPGTGKTLLAKAVAGEAKVPFFSLSGSDFVEMFVGVGASRVRDLFKQAKEKSPAIIFIDEIDAIGRARGKNAMSGGNDERENTLNQLLTEMDGFGTNEHVIVMAATNRADVLDRALMRAGRFDRQIYVDLPDLNERREIFQVHLKPLKLKEGLDTEFLAKQTPGFSGADIANVCNESALVAARKNKKFIEEQDFLDAVDRIVGGLEKKNKIITKGEKNVIAYHEAGHATVSWMLEHAAPLVKVTIVPRGRSLGAAWYLPEERQITTAEQMQDEMCAALGGRAAEKIIFNRISTGALSDLEKVTKQARAMVTVYGLNEKVGNVTYYDSQSGNDYNFNKPYSEKTAQVIDEEISTLIETQYTRALELLTQHKDKLAKLAELLLEKEVIFKENLEEIFGKRIWESNTEGEREKESVEGIAQDSDIHSQTGAE